MGKSRRIRVPCGPNPKHLLTLLLFTFNAIKGYDQYQFIDVFADPDSGLSRELDVVAGGNPHKGKELSMLNHEAHDPNGLSSTVQESTSSPRYTRKTKKPRSWSDFTTEAGSLGLDSRGSEMNLGIQAQTTAPTQVPVAKKPRAATLKRKDSMNSISGAGEGGAGGEDYTGAAVMTSSGGSSGGSRSTLLAAKERRRERNKVLARKTRVKKKAELELLRDQVCLLRAENDRLKSIVKSKLPTAVGAHLLVECDIQLPDNVALAVQSIVDKAEINDTRLFRTLKTAQRSFCISNAQCKFFVILAQTHYYPSLNTLITFL